MPAVVTMRLNWGVYWGKERVGTAYRHTHWTFEPIPEYRDALIGLSTMRFGCRRQLEESVAAAMEKEN